MACYLGTRTAERVLGPGQGGPAFDDLPFPTRPLYFRNPWFLPAVLAWYAWRDRRDFKRANAAARNR